MVGGGEKAMTFNFKAAAGGGKTNFFSPGGTGNDVTRPTFSFKSPGYLPVIHIRTYALSSGYTILTALRNTD